MSAISLKSITGITSITTPAGVDNQLTLHNNNTSEAVKLDVAGNVHINNQLVVTGVTTFASDTHIADSIIHTGDTNTKIRFPGADTITAETAGSEVLRITSDRKVGINRTSPARHLHAYAAGAGFVAKFEGSYSYSAVEFADSGTTNAPYIGSKNDHFTIATGGNNERLRIDSSGRVLIGTTTEGSSASDDLTIATSGTTGITIRSGTSNNGNIEFSDGTSGQDEYRGVVQYAHSDNSMRFYTNATEKVRITSTGMVGIGTDNVDSPLEVVGTGPSLVTIHHGDGGTNDEARIMLGALPNNPPDNRGAGIAAVNNGGGHDLIIKCSTNHSLGPSEKVRITSAGDVGIGTAIPVIASGYGNLSLAGSTGGQLEFKRLSNDIRHYIWGNADLNIGGGYHNGSSSNIVFRVNGSTERLRITSSGKLGTNSTVRSANGGLDLCSQGATNYGTLTLGAGGGQNGQSRSSNQENQFRIMMPTYADPSLMTTVLYGTSGTAGHDLFYGGGTGWAYATNTHRFFTTPGQTTGNGTERIRIKSDGKVQIRSGTVIQFTNTNNDIITDTSDGSDNKRIVISGGGATDSSRGANINLTGNEYSGANGKLELSAGNSGNANGSIDCYTGGSLRLKIDTSGRLLMNGASSNNAFAGGDDLIIGDTSARSGITLVSATGNDGGLYFSKGTSSNNDHVVGQIVFQHDGNGGYFRHYTNALERLRIAANGDIALRNSTNSHQELQWYVNNTKSASIGWGNGSANWEFKHFRNDNQADNPYANIDFFTGDFTTPTRALRITNDGNHIREKHSRFATRIDYTSGNESANSKIPMKAAHVNVGNDFSDSNDRFTAPVDGDYAFWFHTNVMKSGSGSYYATWYKNGSEANSAHGGRMYDQYTGSGWNNLSGCIMLNLSEGDYVEVYNGGQSVNYDGNSYGQFMGWLVG